MAELGTAKRIFAKRGNVCLGKEATCLRGNLLKISTLVTLPTFIKLAAFAHDLISIACSNC